MHLVIAYDIIDNRTRVRLAKILIRHLQRVQKSVFEGEITQSEYQKLKQGIMDTIDHTRDNVRIYHLSAGCKHLTEVIGVSLWTPGEETDEVY